MEVPTANGVDAAVKDNVTLVDIPLQRALPARGNKSFSYAMVAIDLSDIVGQLGMVEDEIEGFSVAPYVFPYYLKRCFEFDFVVDKKTEMGKNRFNGFEPEGKFELTILDSRGAKGVDGLEGRNVIGNGFCLDAAAPVFMFTFENRFKSWLIDSEIPFDDGQYSADWKIPVTDDAIHGAIKMCQGVFCQVKKFSDGKDSPAFDVVIRHKRIKAIVGGVSQCLKLGEMEFVETGDKDICDHGIPPGNGAVTFFFINERLTVLPPYYYRRMDGQSGLWVKNLPLIISEEFSPDKAA